MSESTRDKHHAVPAHGAHEARPAATPTSEIAPTMGLDNLTVVRQLRGGTQGAALPDDPTGNQAMQAAARTAIVQATRDGATAPPTGANVHAAAQLGTSGAAGPLPYVEAIQRSFGRHDVRPIEAHVGAEATAGAERMGAQAFATGHHVGFRGTPSLHTAAHEAAHVVQQRGGVQLAGGVGQSGDRYERHADRVADLVVQGSSSEAVLDEHAGSGALGPAVQRQCASCPPGEPCTCEPAAGAVVQKEDGPFMVPEPVVDEKESPGPVAVTLQLTGPGGSKWQFSSDPLATYDLLGEMWRKHGKEAVQKFAETCDANEPDAEALYQAGEMNSRGWRSDNNTPPPPKTIRPVLDKPPPLPAQTQSGFLERDKVYRAIKGMAGNLVAKHTSTLAIFQRTGMERLQVMLTLSRNQVVAERDRYGLDADNKPTDKSKSADVQKDLAEMAPHARELARLKRQLDAEKAHDVDVRVDVPLGAYAVGAGAKYPILDDTMRAKVAYDKERAYAFNRWPVLAGFDDKADQWENVASGSTATRGGPDALDAIGTQIETKLDSIKHLEEAIGDGSLIWSLPIIVSGTKGVLGIEHGSISDFWIDDNARHLRGKEDFVRAALAVIGVALVLITLIPTGGSSALIAVTSGAAIGGAALTTYEAIEAVKDYQLEHAKANSSFDRAMLLAREEPALFPVAMAVVGAVFDVQQALHAFRSLTSLLRAAKLGEAGAVERLVARGNEIRPAAGGMRGLGDELAGGLGSVGRRVDTPKALLESEKLGEIVPVIGKHEGVFSKTGKLHTCSPYCTEAWWRYENILKERPDLRYRLKQIESGVLDEATALARKPEAKELLDELVQLQSIREMPSTQLYAALESLPGTSIGRELRSEAIRRFGTAKLGPLHGKAAEYPALAARDAEARLLPENFRAFDGVNAVNPATAKFHYEFGTEIINGETVTVINQHITGGKWYSVKTLDKVATETRVADNVETALKKAWDDAKNRVPYTPARDPVAAPDGTRWRVWKDGPAAEIEIVIQVPIKNVTNEAAELAEAQAWADKVLQASTMRKGLPPTKVVVQAKPIGPR